MIILSFRRDAPAGRNFDSSVFNGKTIFNRSGPASVVRALSRNLRKSRIPKRSIAIPAHKEIKRDLYVLYVVFSGKQFQNSVLLFGDGMNFRSEGMNGDERLMIALCPRITRRRLNILTDDDDGQ